MAHHEAILTFAIFIVIFAVPTTAIIITTRAVVLPNKIIAR
jgi:hypothetical protein